MNTRKDFLVIILSLTVSILMLGLIGFNENIGSLKREAIERNFAEYNSTNGHWQWKSK